MIDTGKFCFRGKGYLKLMLVITLTALGLRGNVEAAPRLLVIPNGIVDLGEFEEKDVQVRDVWAKNIGDEELVILRIFTPCGCLSVDYTPAGIAPGDSTLLKVVFDGRRRKPGPVKKVLRLTTNGEPGVSSVLVKGEIVKPFQER